VILNDKDNDFNIEHLSRCVGHKYVYAFLYETSLIANVPNKSCKHNIGTIVMIAHASPEFYIWYVTPGSGKPENDSAGGEPHDISG
jgi:hypothetical protein